MFFNGDFEPELMDKFASECASKLKEEEIHYIKLHLSYYHHHFGYGLYLRNHYANLVPITSDMQRDDLSQTIYTRILQKIIPEFGTDLQKISSLINDQKFTEISAHYYLRNGVMPFQAYPIESWNYVEFDDSNEDFYTACNKWRVEYEKNLNAYVMPIAESLWDYQNFKQRAMADGLNETEIDEAYAYCRNLFLEKHFFIPLEVVYCKNEHLLNPEIIQILHVHLQYFCEDHFHHRQLLPPDLFTVREIVKMLVECNGRCLELAPKFKDDDAIVKTAVKNSPKVIEFASRRLKNDLRIVRTAASNSRYCLIFEVSCMKKYRDDDSIVKLALRANGANICYASKRIRDDYDMAKYALQHQRDFYPCTAFKSLSARLRDDKSLALLEIASHDPDIASFSKRLKNDDEIGEIIYKKKRTRYLLYHMSKRIQKKYCRNE